jgi:methylphosphotriester-DNA--protein-cysteine methyltransferase
MYGQTQVHPAVTKFLLLLDAKSDLFMVPLPAIAMELGVSVSHLQHLVRRHTGRTCTKLIRERCVEEMRKHCCVDAVQGFIIVPRENVTFPIHTVPL